MHVSIIGTKYIGSVTGDSGFVGSHLTEHLPAEGYEVTGVDCFRENYAWRIKDSNCVPDLGQGKENTYLKKRCLPFGLN